MNVKVMEVIQKLNNNRSVGEDSVQIELIHYGGVKLRKILLIAEI